MQRCTCWSTRTCSHALESCSDLWVVYVRGQCTWERRPFDVLESDLCILREWSMRKRSQSHPCVCVRVCVCCMCAFVLSVCVCVCVHVVPNFRFQGMCPLECVHMYVCMCITHPYIHSCTCVYVPTHLHIHTYTHLPQHQEALQRVAFRQSIVIHHLVID